MNKKDNIPKFIYTTSTKLNPFLLVEDSYLFNLKRHNKDNSDNYTCKEYKTNKQCKAFIKIRNKEKIDFSNDHNHDINQIKIVHEETRKKIQTEIKNSSDPFSIKIPKIIKSNSANKGIKWAFFHKYKNYFV